MIFSHPISGIHKILRRFARPAGEMRIARDPMRYWLERVLHALFVTGVVLGFLAVIPSIWLSIKERLYAIAVFDATAYTVLLVLFFRKSLPFVVRAASVVFIFFMAGVLLFFTLGPSGAGPVFLFGFPVVTGVLLGHRWAMGALALNGITLLAVGVLLFSGFLSWEYPVVNPVAKWTVVFFNFMLFDALATVSVTSILRGLQSALRKETLLRNSLQHKHAELVNSNRDLQREIAQKKQLIRDLKESDRKVLLLAENALDCIWQTDRELRFTYVNPAVERIFGFSPEEWIGTRLADHCSTEEVEKFIRPVAKLMLGIRRDRQEILFETRLHHRDGQAVPVEILAKHLTDGRGQIIGMQGSARDIRERKLQEKQRAELEGQIRQSQKIQSIGTLAGGIAHDFNNILAAVIGYTDLAMLELRKGIRQEAHLKEVIRAAMRAKELVRQILTFSRQSDQEKKPLQAGLIVKEVVKLIRSAISTTIDIESRVTSTGLVMANPTQIHQILMNLCTNASHAMEEKGGTLAIEAAEVELDEAFTRCYPELHPGKYLKMQVADSGTGIDPEVMSSIFEPYFTTKEPGTGTGLGLAVVHGIVKDHHGEITVESEYGKGSVFCVYLPLLKNEVEEIPEAEPKIPTGRESILFADDEPSLVRTTKQILEQLGYRVTAATDSREALEIFSNDPDGFDLVITDMNMPKMPGDRLAAEMMKIRPNLPVVICTGYSRKLSEKKISATGLKGIIMKPFSRSELAGMVRRH